jgi:hypothetical protein
VAAVDVTAAVAFQAGELLLAGVVQIADASAQELAQSGDPAAALAAGVSETRHVVATASAPVVSAVTTAVANIRNSLHDPFPAAVRPTSRRSRTSPPRRGKRTRRYPKVAVVSGIPMWRPNEPVHSRSRERRASGQERAQGSREGRPPRQPSPCEGKLVQHAAGHRKQTSEPISQCLVTREA